MTALPHACRSLKRTPVFAITVILTLAVGIAALGSMFAIVYGVLLAPLPYGQPDRLVSLRLQTAESGGIGIPPALQVTYQQHAQSLDDVALYRTGSTNIWSPGDDALAESVVATWVTASMVPMLQIPPLLGRSFTAEEELRGGPNAVILSESEWRSRYGASPEVIGKTLMVNSVAREIIGVMPAAFSFPSSATRVWLPAKRIDSATVGDFFYSAVARLAPGVSAAQAQQELVTILPRLAESFPRLEHSNINSAGGSVSGSSTASWLADLRPMPIIVPLREQITASIAGTLWMLAAAAGLVLLVAWANVANLMLIRADARQAELAVRSALGASRLRTASHFLAEALLLGACAGALALWMVHGVVALIIAFGPSDLPRLAELDVGLPALAFSAWITAISVFICVAVPAARSWRSQLFSQLHDGGRGASTGKPRLRLRAIMATLQIAVGLVVTLGSALLLRTAYSLYQVHPGFETTHVTTLRTQLPFARYGEAASVAFYARLAEQVRQLPSVQSSGLTAKVPLGSGHTLEESFRKGSGQETLSLPVNVIDDGYFATMSIPMLAGRGFRSLDLERGTDIIISRKAAETVFGDASGTASVGKQMTLAPWGLAYTVIEVVADVRDQDLATPAAGKRPLARIGTPTDARFTRG